MSGCKICLLKKPFNGIYKVNLILVCWTNKCRNNMLLASSSGYGDYGNYCDYHPRSSLVSLKSYPQNSILSTTQWCQVDTSIIVHPSHILLSLANYFQCKTNAFIYAYHMNNWEHYTDSFSLAFAYSQVCDVFIIPIFDLNNHTNKDDAIETVTKKVSSKSREIYATELLCNDTTKDRYKDWIYKILHLSKESYERLRLIKTSYEKDKNYTLENEAKTYEAYNELYLLMQPMSEEWYNAPRQVKSCNVSISIASNAAKDTVTMFRTIECSEKVPYVEIQHHHSTFSMRRIHTFTDIEFPTKMLNVEPISEPSFDGIVLLMMCKKDPLLVTVKSAMDKEINNYVDNTYMVKYMPVEYNTLTKTISFKYDLSYGESCENIIDRICYEFGYVPSEYLISYTNCMQKKVLTNVYIYPNLLNYMLLYHPKFAEVGKYVFVDESKQTSLMSKKTKLRIQLNNSRISISLESSVAKRQVTKYKTKIYDGWSYTIVSYYKVHNMHISSFADNILETVFNMYNEVLDEVKQLLDITYLYKGDEDIVKGVPEIIYDIKQEVPELWVPNTSKQVTSSSLIILRDEEVMKRYCSGPNKFEAILYPDPREEHLAQYSRWYSSTDKRRPNLGLIVNTKENADMFRFLPNTYTRSHRTNSHHYGNYYLDPINYDGKGTQITTQDIYKKDSSARKNKGKSECPKFIENMLFGTVNDVPYKVYRKSHASGNNRFGSTMFDIFGHYDPDAVVPYLYMCRQEIPGYSLKQIEDLFYSGCNPMYFVRAYEMLYDVNILIITVRDASYRLFPYSTRENYMWRPVPGRPYVILLCFVKSRSKYIYESLYKEDTHSYFWHDNVTYTNITRYVIDQLACTVPGIPMIDRITAQYIRDDGIVTAARLDDGYWIGVETCPMHVEHVQVTADDLPDYESIKNLGTPRGYVNIHGIPTVVCVETDSGVKYLVKPSELDDVAYDDLYQSFYPEDSVVTRYEKKKRTMLLRRDVLVSIVLSSSDPYMVLDEVEYTDHPEVYDNITHFVEAFKYKFETGEEAIEYYRDLGIRLQFHIQDKRTIESLINQVARREHVSYSLSKDYLFLHTPLRNVLCFHDKNEYLAWKHARTTLLHVRTVLKKDKIDYVYECRIRDKMHKFEVLCSVMGDMEAMKEYFVANGRESDEYVEISANKDFIEKLREVEELSEALIILRYRKDWYCPIKYVEEV